MTQITALTEDSSQRTGYDSGHRRIQPNGSPVQLLSLDSEGDFAGSGGEIWRGMGAISSRVKIVGGRRSSLRFKAKREKGTERYRDPRKKQSFSIAWGVFPPLSQWPFLLQKVEIRHDYFPIELN